MKQDQGQAGSSFPGVPVLSLVALVLLFTALGLWQVKRLAWKEALIAKVEQRVDAPPVAPPDEAAARASSLPELEYLRVRLSGAYVASGTALVRAVTDLGAGYWVLTPLRTGDGRLIYVNRGYVPTGSRLEAARAATPQGQVSIVGLLRLTEPGGGFLRSNDPAGDRWYSRDVEALARARGLSHVAPFFVDAQTEGTAAARPAGSPVPGLTVIRFANSHLSYALTWFAMAAGSLGLAFWLWRRGAAA
ncbi:SURF1-like protein [Sphingobium jiangsuense]|uniref:SURF1-like protein n=1 Tax=Sphingobium jiangsuense TaxID=870476 RepID=A0A7W6BJY4_9SPHN|nr:SURF1 family protein [Sphingobium jiangsuense]MBB3928426.1 surfeit locus 1 family protein [Sphingobium jiangsuense]GLT02429.1 SURF1-like protein [Sphingobium jiangsuense]